MTEAITEYRNENTKDIDLLSTIDMVRKMNENIEKLANNDAYLKQEIDNLKNMISE